MPFTPDTTVFCFEFFRCPHNVGVVCEAKGSQELIKEWCDGKRQCEIDPSNHAFGGDPCPGFPKYVEVLYSCVDAIKGS